MPPASVTVIRSPGGRLAGAVVAGVDQHLAGPGPAAVDPDHVDGGRPTSTPQTVACSGVASSTATRAVWRVRASAAATLGRARRSSRVPDVEDEVVGRQRYVGEPGGADLVVHPPVDQARHRERGDAGEGERQGEHGEDRPGAVPAEVGPRLAGGDAASRSCRPATGRAGRGRRGGRPGANGGDAGARGAAEVAGAGVVDDPPGWQLATTGPQAVTGQHSDGAVTLQGRSQLTGQLTGVTTGSVNGRGREHSHVDRRASQPDGVTHLTSLGLRQRPLSSRVDVHRITAQRGGHIVDRRGPHDCRPGCAGEQREDGNDEAPPHEATLSVARRETPRRPDAIEP